MTYIMEQQNKHYVKEIYVKEMRSIIAGDIEASVSHDLMFELKLQL